LARLYRRPMAGGPIVSKFSTFIERYSYPAKGRNILPSCATRTRGFFEVAGPPRPLGREDSHPVCFLASRSRVKTSRAVFSFAACPSTLITFFAAFLNPSEDVKVFFLKDASSCYLRHKRGYLAARRDGELAGAKQFP
jgi:hypothetical protein